MLHPNQRISVNLSLRLPPPPPPPPPPPLLSSGGLLLMAEGHGWTDQEGKERNRVERTGSM